MMRYIVRLVLPVAVLTIITGMLPVLPTDIGGTNQLAQVSDVVGGSGGLLNGNGNTQFEQRLEERQQNLSGGSLNDFQLPGTGGSDPFYYQIVPQVPTTGSSGATSPTGSLGGSNTGTGASPSDTSGSSGATTGSTGGSVIIPRSSGVLPGVNLYQNQAGQIIQEQFRQQQTQVVEADSLPDLLQNSTAAFDLSGCLEECEEIEAQAANECQEKNPKQDRLKACLDAAYNTKVECQRRCRETAKNQGSGGSSSGAGNSSAAQSLQVWVPETTNLVTLQTGEAGRTPLVLLPSTAANVSLSELPGYVSVSIVPVVLPSSKAIEITQTTGAKLQVEDAGSLLDSIAVANDILGREEVRTQSGGTLVIPGAKTTALSAIGRGVVDVSRSISSVFTNISDFFGALVGDERVLTESPDDSSLSGSASGCPPPTGGSAPTCSETACRTKTGTGICQLKTENVPGYTNGKIFSTNKSDFAASESLVATTQAENSCECVSAPIDNPPPPVAGEKCPSPKDMRRASANESISASVTISLDPLGLLFDGNECVPEEKCIGEKVTGRDASGNLKTECVNRAVINVCHTVADNKAIARDQAALEAAQDALEAEQEAACNKKIADKVNSILDNAPNLKCQPPAQDGNGKACLGPGVKFSYEVDECAVDSVTMTEIKGGDTPQMRISIRGSGSGSSVAEFGCFNGSATPYEAPEPEKPTPPTPPSGGGSSGGGGGSNLNPVSLDDVAIPEPQSFGIADIPAALGSIVREKLFGAFFSVSPGNTGDEVIACSDTTATVSVKTAIVYNASTCDESQSVGINSCIKTVVSQYAERSKAACNTACASANAGVAACQTGTPNPDKLPEKVCSAGSCATVGSSKQVRVDGQGSWSIQCACGPSGGGATGSGADSGSGGSTGGGAGSGPTAPGSIPEPPQRLSLIDSCSNVDVAQCSNSINCTQKTSDGILVKSGVCGLYQNDQTGAIFCGCGAPTPSVSAPEVVPQIEESPAKCGAPRIKAGDTTVLSIADLEKQVSDQIPLAAEGRLGDDTPADIIKLYAAKIECQDVQNACKAGSCTPFIGIENGKAVASCGCSGNDSDNSSPKVGPSTPVVSGGSVPSVPADPEPVKDGGTGFDPEEEAIAPLAPAAQPPAAPRPVGVGVLYSINSFVQTIGNALDPFRFFANESPALQVVQDDSCRIKGDQLSRLGLTSKQDGENKVYYFNGEKFYTKTKDGKITDRSLEVEKKYNEAYKSFCGAKACGTGGKCQQGSDGLCNVCAEPEEEAPAPQLPAAPDGKAPAGGKAGEPEEVPFNFLAWELSSESCSKYSAENIKQAVEAYFAENPGSKDLCERLPDDAPTWKKMIFPWVHPSCVPDVDEAKSATCSSNRCGAAGTVCKLNAEASGCECVPAGKTPEAPAYGAPGTSSKPPTAPATPDTPAPTTRVTLDNCQLTSAAAGFSFPKEGENAGKIMFTDSAGKTTVIMDKAAFVALSKEAQKKVMENTKTSTGKSIANAANEAGKAVCEANSCKANSATKCVFDPKKDNLTDRCYCPTKTAPPAPAATPAAPATGGSGGSTPPAPTTPVTPAPTGFETEVSCGESAKTTANQCSQGLCDSKDSTGTQLKCVRSIVIDYSARTATPTCSCKNPTCYFFTTSWCPHCPAAKARLDAAGKKCIVVDGDGDPRKLQQKYGVRGYPTVVDVDANGNKVGSYTP